MALDVDTPTPPDLTNRNLPGEVDPGTEFGGDSDLRRGELETAFRDGAWTEAFQEWAEYTDLTEDDYQAVLDAGLIIEFDFYWDPEAEELAFDPPELPADWPADTVARSLVRTELADLGETVVEMLEDTYVDWGATQPTEDIWDEERQQSLQEPEEIPPED